MTGEKTLGIGSSRTRTIKNVLTQAIDEQTSLIEAVQRALTNQKEPFFPKFAAKFIMKQTWDNLSQDIENLYPLFRALKYVNPNWYPQTPKQWKDFHTCVTGFHSFQKISQSHPIEQCLLETKGKWHEYAAIIQKHGAIQDAMDWKDMVYKKIVLPVFINERIIAPDEIHEGIHKITANELFFKTLKFKDIIEASSRWHEQYDDFNTKTHALTGTNNKDSINSFNWLPLSQTMQASNGVWLRPLTTPEELHKQGKDQKHCVGSYPHICRTDRSHIIRLSKDEAGKQVLTTAQLKEKGEWNNPDNITVSLNQHQGHKRRQPTSTEKEAIKWYIDEINNNNKLKPHWDKIITRKQEHRATEMKNSPTTVIGFDYKDQNMCMRIFDICRPYLGTKSQRNMSYERYMAHIGINLTSLQNQSSLQKLAL